MDVHVPFAITIGLRLRHVDVLTAQADGADRLEDPALLERAAERGRILFSQDVDLLRIAQRWQRTRTPFGGLVFAHQLRVNIGTCVADLEVIAKVTEPDEWHGEVVFLPLRSAAI